MFIDMTDELAYFDCGAKLAKKAGNISAVESLISKLDEYSCLNKNASYMFSAAKNGAEYILDQLIKKGESKWISRN